MGEEDKKVLLLSFAAVETMEVVLHDVYRKTGAVLSLSLDNKTVICP